MNTEFFEFFAIYTNLLTLSAAVMALFIWWRQLKRTTKQNMKVESNSIIGEFTSPLFMREMHLARNVTRSDFEEYLKFRGERPHQKGADELILVLNFFERMAQMIDSEIADEEYLARYLSARAVQFFNQFEWAIGLLRDDTGSKNLYRTYEKLVGRWSFHRDQS